MSNAAYHITAAQSIVDEYRETGLVNTAEAIGWIPVKLIPSFKDAEAKLDAYYREKEKVTYTYDEDATGYINSVKNAISSLIENLNTNTFKPRDKIGMEVQVFWPLEGQYNRLSSEAKAILYPVAESSLGRYFHPRVLEFLKGCRPIYLPLCDADLLPLTYDQALGRIAVEHLQYALNSVEAQEPSAASGHGVPAPADEDG